jgi:quercetin dioxygenase-like cupin family protein
MRVIKSSKRADEPANEAPKEHFSGLARIHSLHETPELTRVAFVHFATGVRNHWHSHAGGQVLHIVEGEAQVQVWDAEVQTLEVGDTAVAAPGEKHWHGAAEGSSMTHLAITSGDATWFDS